MNCRAFYRHNFICPRNSQTLCKFLDCHYYFGGRQSYGYVRHKSCFSPLCLQWFISMANHLQTFLGILSKAVWLCRAGWRREGKKTLWMFWWCFWGCKWENGKSDGVAGERGQRTVQEVSLSLPMGHASPNQRLNRRTRGRRKIEEVT